MSDKIVEKLANMHPYRELWEIDGYTCVFCYRTHKEPHKESCLWLSAYRLHTGESDYTGDWVYKVDSKS